MPLKNKKAQMISEVLKYLIVGIICMVVIVIGYMAIAKLTSKGCDTEFTKFEIDLRAIDKDLRFGEKKLRSYLTPCKVDKVYFFDRSKSVNPQNFKDSPILMDSMTSGSTSNVYLVQDDDVKRSFSAGNIVIPYPHFMCVQPKLDKISFSVEGTGAGARISHTCEQPDCAFVLNDINEREARKILTEVLKVGCNDCPSNVESGMQEFRQSNSQVSSWRRFSHCSESEDIEISARVKDKAAKNVLYIEHIPTECVEGLEEHVSLDSQSAYIAGQFIIIKFGDIEHEEKVSYKINKELDDSCKAAIKGILLVR